LAKPRRDGRLSAVITLRAIGFVGAMLLTGSEVSFGQTSLAKFKKPSANSPGEPLAKRFSAAKAVDFIDRASLHWQRSRECVTCHTNGAYLLGRARLQADPAPHAAVRQFFEQYVTGWSEKKPDPYIVVATAAALALDDSAKGKLSPATRNAFAEAWKTQQKDGSWDWLKCGWGPYESDDHYGVTLAAIAVASAPENYAASRNAATGYKKLLSWLKKNRPKLAHQKGMMLWLSQVTPDAVSSEDKLNWQKDLLALQQADGGWAIATLGDWKRADGTEQIRNRSDGYGTGFVVFALRKSGMAPDHTVIRRGVQWLKANQRESGRWFTRSTYNDKHHFITHAGTTFALLALTECNELTEARQ